MEPEKDRRDHSDSWAPPPPPALIVVADDVPDTASVPAAEGLWAGRRRPPHGVVSSLVGGGSPRPLSEQRRAPKSLFPLLFYSPVAPPPAP